MTEHKFTDGEIMRALECCGSSYQGDLHFRCSNCPLHEVDIEPVTCFDTFLHDLSLDLINRQKAEIERLEAPRFMVTPTPIAEDNLTPLAKLQKIVIYDEPSVSIKRIDEEGIRAEAIKEFAERLKSRLIIYTHINLNNAIDKLVKEMTEEKT